MKLFNLGELNWRQSQLIYHALAYKNIESLVFHSSKDSFMCVGLHQDPRDELDIDYCKKNSIGIFRREIGGGTVLLDKDQIFYNLILNRNHPKVPFVPESFFRRFLQPVIDTFNELGIPAKYRSLCDLVVNGKKISGNGGGEIGECKVLGGSILLDFDYERMANSMLLPADIRSRFVDLMKSNLTTVEKELGFIPKKEKICSILSNKFEELIGPLTNGSVDLEINKKMAELDKHYSSDSWLYQRGTKQIGKEVKVCEGVYIFYNVFDTKNGSLEVTFEIKDNIVKKITFSDSKIMSNITSKKFQENFANKIYDRNKLYNEIIEFLKNNGVISAT
ncbi:hypothetical protein AYK24_09145 [Thermoplasmatales archaeon SG8-52-4]|nr:MAG: hypothetical protein AYK24_09145 [Thermoplasmatales archaeon SG8-52-4]